MAIWASTKPQEDFGPLVPVSTYGASKLAGEALIASYCAMFGLTACAFRFGNVVGPRQTHGVGFDFVRRLQRQPDSSADPGRRPAKQVVHSRGRRRRSGADGATKRPGRLSKCTTSRPATTSPSPKSRGWRSKSSGLSEDQVRLEYTGGDRGWKGDVPVVRLNTDRIRTLGWTCRRTSRQALCAAMHSMLEDVRAGRL